MAINWSHIDRLARAHRIIKPTSSEDALLRQLKRWWCLKYNRPFKDPLLLDYTLDELVYEYLSYFYSEPENDPNHQEEVKANQDQDDAWVASQLAQMRLEEEKRAEAKKAPETPAPEPIADLPEISTKFDG